MIALPPPLAGWSALTTLLPVDLAAGLGPWIERLVLALGPLRAARPRPGGEPDGFSGITRRGSYERLLLSEWMLADELPDEFARRATMGEHAFHALARRTPSHAATSIALFDAGPDQLGSPRIVHLAALIALADRAERAGARFEWGMLHEPDRPLALALTAESALRLLVSRTASVLGDDALHAWSLRARKSAWEDVWIVGRSAPPRAPVAAWSPASIEAHDVLDPARRAVRVTVSLPSLSPRSLDLDLPDEAACARLLRNPFKRPAPTPRAKVEAVPTSNLIFAANGTKILTRGLGGEILAYPIPGSYHAAMGRPKRYAPKSRGVVVAAGWFNRGIVLLIADKDELRFELANGRLIAHLKKPLALTKELGFAVPTLADPLLPIFFTSDGPRLVAVMLDARGALYAMSNELDPPILRVAPEVASLAVVRDQLSFVGHDVELDATLAGFRLDPREDSGPLGVSRWQLFVVGAPGRPGSSRSLSVDSVFEAVPGFIQDGSAGAALIAVRWNATEWMIVSTTRSVVLHPPSGARVVGVHQHGMSGEPELILLEADKRAISFLGRSTSSTLLRASSDIVHVTQCTTRSTLAYATVTGEIALHELRGQQPFARFLPKGGA